MDAASFAAAVIGGRASIRTRRGPIGRRPSPALSAGGRIPGIADDPRLPIFDDEDGRMSVAGGPAASGEKE